MEFRTSRGCLELWIPETTDFEINQSWAHTLDTKGCTTTMSSTTPCQSCSGITDLTTILPNTSCQHGGLKANSCQPTGHVLRTIQSQDYEPTPCFSLTPLCLINNFNTCPFLDDCGWCDGGINRNEKETMKILNNRLTTWKRYECWKERTPHWSAKSRKNVTKNSRSYVLTTCPTMQPLRSSSKRYTS